MKSADQRSAVYAGLIREMAEPIDPTRFYCLICCEQFHECVCDGDREVLEQAGRPSISPPDQP